MSWPMAMIQLRSSYQFPFKKRLNEILNEITRTTSFVWVWNRNRVELVENSKPFTNDLETLNYKQAPDQTRYDFKPLKYILKNRQAKGRGAGDEVSHAGRSRDGIALPSSIS